MAFVEFTRDMGTTRQVKDLYVIHIKTYDINIFVNLPKKKKKY